jgi:hypothetical protein
LVLANLAIAMAASWKHEKKHPQAQMGNSKRKEKEERKPDFPRNWRQILDVRHQSLPPMVVHGDRTVPRA